MDMSQHISMMVVPTRGILTTTRPSPPTQTRGTPTRRLTNQTVLARKTSTTTKVGSVEMAGGSAVTLSDTISCSLRYALRYCHLAQAAHSQSFPNLILDRGEGEGPPPEGEPMAAEDGDIDGQYNPEDYNSLKVRWLAGSTLLCCCHATHTSYHRSCRRFRMM
jgi:hypothetical protein